MKVRLSFDVIWVVCIHFSCIQIHDIQPPVFQLMSPSQLDLLCKEHVTILFRSHGRGLYVVSYSNHKIHYISYINEGDMSLYHNIIAWDVFSTENSFVISAWISDFLCRAWMNNHNMKMMGGLLSHVLFSDELWQ